MQKRKVIINGIDTVDSFDFLMTQKTVSPPEVKTNYIDIEGASSFLDVSEALGSIAYKDRIFTASFLSDEEYPNRLFYYRQMLNLWHGKRVTIVDPDRADKILKGRMTVNAVVHHGTYSEYSVSAKCEPFYFEPETKQYALVVSGTETLTIVNEGNRTVIPRIKVENNISILIDGVTIALSTGTTLLTNIPLSQGSKTLTITGTGAVKIEFDEGWL